MRDGIKKSLDRYVEHGIPPGGFLEAVLCNNLMEAMGRADIENHDTIFEICQYVYNEMPGNCHGSPEIVAAWYERKSAEREVSL